MDASQRVESKSEKHVRVLIDNVKQGGGERKSGTGGNAIPSAFGSATSSSNVLTKYGTASDRPLRSGQMMMSTYSSGRLAEKTKHQKFIQYDMDDEVDCTKLLKAIAKSEDVIVDGKPVLKYIPMYKHPLPVSKTRHEHELVLRRVLSAPLPRQAIAAVTIGDAYVLEEVYMRGAPVEVRVSWRDCLTSADVSTNALNFP